MSQSQDTEPEMEPSMAVEVRSGEGEIGGTSAMPACVLCWVAASFHYRWACPLPYPDLICFQGP